MPACSELVNLLRELTGAGEAITEKAMFGGLAFLLDGNLAFAASGQGGLLVRVDPELTDAHAARPHASIAVMRGRPMRGWVRVAAEGVRGKRQLRPWVHESLAYVRTLPPKR
ncbi:MAG TPA: TfoX/Sxy family protein [Solirubrobacteraceae bacterium]|nr:TfoX/Sxy family protein [Solirubrobacteraceae bacterium]